MTDTLWFLLGIGIGVGSWSLGYWLGRRDLPKTSDVEKAMLLRGDVKGLGSDVARIEEKPRKLGYLVGE